METIHAQRARNRRERRRKGILKATCSKKEKGKEREGYCRRYKHNTEKEE